MADIRFGAGRAGEAANPSVNPSLDPSLTPMARMAASSSPETAAAAVPGGERTDYGASGGRKTAFSFLMLLLLPFFASLPFMLFQRINHGLWFDIVPLLITGAVFAVVMFFILIELLFSLRAYLSLGKTSVNFTLPSGRGPTPMLRYVSLDIPYRAIKNVEVRREIFGGTIAPVMLRGALIRTKDEREVLLGYVSEANVDPAFPYPQIAEQIARRAGVPIIDQGSIWRRDKSGPQMGFMAGSSHMQHVADRLEIDALNRSHRRMVLALVNVLVVLLLIGLAADFFGT